MREKIRNRLLRRADWRFLLPTSKPSKSICFANGLLAEAVELISESVADASLPDPPSDCDLAVAVNPSHATLRAAWAALRPGGASYMEWYSPLAGGPQGIRQRLEALGFEGVTCYWPWPWPTVSSPRSWVPVEASGAVRYFLSSRPPARRVVRRIGDAILRAVWLLNLRLGFILPVCAIAHKPASSAKPQPSVAATTLASTSRAIVTSAINPDVLQAIRSNWDTRAFGSFPDRLSSLVLTGGHRTVGKVVTLIFAEPDNHPRMALKIPRVPESIAGLKREAATLQWLQQSRNGRLHGVPRVLFCREHAGVLTLGETALAGRPMLTLLRTENFRDLALKVTDWLVDLAGQPASCPPAMWWKRLVEPVINEFDETFGAVVDRGMLRETQDMLKTIGALPVVCEQRDFGPWNVLLTAAGELAVLDWESSEPQGLPAMDLIYFLSFSALSLHGGIDPALIRARYRDTLNPSTATGGVVHECVERYAAATGLDPAQLRGLRLLCWLLHSRSEYGWFIADFAKKPEPENLLRSIFLSFWEQEIRHGA